MQFVFEKREGSSRFIASFFSKTSRKCLTKRNVRPSHHLFHAWMQITVGFSSCESKKKRIFIVIPHKNHCKYGSNYSQCSVFFEAALLFKCKIIIASLYFTKAIWQMRNVF